MALGNRSGHHDQGQSTVSSEHSDAPRRVPQGQSLSTASSLTAQQLFYHIKQEILRTDGPGDLQYESIFPTSATKSLEAFPLMVTLNGNPQQYHTTQPLPFCVLLCRQSFMDL